VPHNNTPVPIASASELARLLSAGQGAISSVDLRPMSRVLDLVPEDMTVTVESGVTLGALQSDLARHGQWLPIDPPGKANLTIHRLLAENLSGPRRYGYGTIREHLIGMKVVLADGRTIKSGGKVVKNVAGYDLAKLFIGARDSLGIIVEATFKVRPLPEREQFLFLTAPLAPMQERLRAVLDSELTPVVIDLHGGAEATLVLGLAGTKTEVTWQVELARALGFQDGGGLEYEEKFWAGSATVHRVSVLPSRVVETISTLQPASFVARAGNGAIYFTGAAPDRKPSVPAEMMRRMKTTFDPRNVLPEVPL
jgi:FAD/FMN-containing dehydrogenase